MTIFVHILPTVNREGLQKGNGPGNVREATAGLAGLFAEVMAQALSPASKETVTPTGQKPVEVENENQPPLKAEPQVEAGKFYNDGNAPRQIITANVPTVNVTWPAIVAQKPGAQPISFQSNSTVPGKPAGKPNDVSKTNKNPQLPELRVDQAATSPPINQMAAAAVPVDLIPKSIPVPTPSAGSAALQRPGRDPGAAITAYQMNPVQSKSVAPAVSADTAENRIVVNQPPAVSAAVPTAEEAAESAAINTGAVLAAKVFSPETKTNAGSGQESASSAQLPAAQMSSDINGISIAKQDTSVNQAEKTNNIAGQTEKVLPGNAIVAAQANAPLPGTVHMEQVAVTVPTGDQASSNAPAAAAVSATSVSSASNANSLERAQEMITVNAVRLSDSGNNAMQVVIKPDAGTQLSLELRQHGAGVEVQAVLQQGNFNHLSQQWPDLQQRLGHRGIQLAPLTDNAAVAYSNGGESYQQKGQQTAEPADELQVTDLTSRPVVPTMVQAPLIAHEPAQRGWETWA